MVACSAQLIGLSKNSFNLVGFYDMGPVSTRLSYVWRDRYLNGTGSTMWFTNAVEEGSTQRFFRLKVLP